MSTSVSEHIYQEDLYNIPASIMIITSRPWHDIADDEKALLAKILGSVRVNMGSVMIRYMPAVTVESLKAFAPQKVLAFGSSVDGGIKPYEKTTLNGVSIISADDLGQLDDLKKKNLWLALKQMFGL